MSSSENLDTTDDVGSGDTSDPISPDEYGELNKFRYSLTLKLNCKHYNPTYHSLEKKSVVPRFNLIAFEL